LALVQVYSPSRDSWRALAAPMHTERKYHGVCALDGRLFVVGGMNEARARLNTVEAYDPREGEGVSPDPSSS
jgi:hypothetical protein